MLDVPRVADGAAALDRMLEIGRELAAGLGGKMVDDNRAGLSEAGITRISEQLALHRLGAGGARHHGGRRARAAALLLMAGVPQHVAARVEALRAEIERANHEYYVLDAPALPDAEYDRLFRELQRLEAEYPALRSPDSPTQRVGGAARTDLPEVRHACRCSRSAPRRIPGPAARPPSTSACGAS